MYTSTGDEPRDEGKLEMVRSLPVRCGGWGSGDPASLFFGLSTLVGADDVLRLS